MSLEGSQYKGSSEAVNRESSVSQNFGHILQSTFESSQTDIPGETMESCSLTVQLGGGSSHQSSEINSVSYQKLLDEDAPLDLISRQSSMDSIDTNVSNGPDIDQFTGELDAFTSSDLPLSEHFPLAALNRVPERLPRGESKLVLSEGAKNYQLQIKLKEYLASDASRNDSDIEPTNQMADSRLDTEDRTGQYSNIPIFGSVKEFERESELRKIPKNRQAANSFKKSPGVAQRVLTQSDQAQEKCNKENKMSHSTTSQSGTVWRQHSLPQSKDSDKTNDSFSDVTAVPQNMDIENEYDYVRYTRIHQGSSYVGMRLAYSSCSDSVNLKHHSSSPVSLSREQSPDKNAHRHEEHRGIEDTLTEIPLDNSDNPDDKKTFTLSPENTECDSVEIDSVTSDGAYSALGFPTVEDGLSATEASDVDEEVAGATKTKSLASSPELFMSNQQTDFNMCLTEEEKSFHSKEIDAQAIMDDLKMKREALDMAIADIKSAIQQSKYMTLGPSEPSHLTQDKQEELPVWVKGKQDKHRFAGLHDELDHTEVSPELGRRESFSDRNSCHLYPEKDTLCRYIEVNVVQG